MKYQSLDREIHKMWDNAKEELICNDCGKKEEFEAHHKTRQMYEKVIIDTIGLHLFEPIHRMTS